MRSFDISGRNDDYRDVFSAYIYCSVVYITQEQYKQELPPKYCIKGEKAGKE